MTFNIKEIYEDSNDLVDGLFLIDSVNKDDEKILIEMRKIAQKFNRMFKHILEKV